MAILALILDLLPSGKLPPAAPQTLATSEKNLSYSAKGHPKLIIRSNKMVKDLEEDYITVALLYKRIEDKSD